MKKKNVIRAFDPICTGSILENVRQKLPPANPSAFNNLFQLRIKIIGSRLIVFRSRHKMLC